MGQRSIDRERRIEWLVDNQDLWYGKDYDIGFLEDRLLPVMKRAGLYNAYTAKISIQSIVREASRRIRYGEENAF